MELVSFPIPRSLKKLVIAPISDIQWSGKNGPTAKDALKRHIERCLALDAYFIGVGDYIDFLSPSNRARLTAADLYDTAMAVIWEKAMELTHELYDEFLKPCTGRFIGLLHGHHYCEIGAEHTDDELAKLLKTRFIGTSAFIRISNADFTMYAHHGTGSGVLPAPGLNRMYHVAAGLQGADVYLMGHNCKLATGRLSRPYPRWDTKPPRLEHRDIWLVNCGGFSKSNVVGHRVNALPRGDYAEMALLTPAPLNAPIITVDLEAVHDRIRVSI